MARAVLPALLGAAWLTLALAVLVRTGVLHGWLWPRSAFSRVQGSRPPPCGSPGPRRSTRPTRVPDPLGPGAALADQPGASVVVGLIGGYPMLRAVHAARSMAAR